MPSADRTIQGLAGGVSQQAPIIRLETQHEDQRNTLNSVINGMEKRPGTEHLSTLATDIDALIQSEDVLYHEIQRDGTEEYIVLFTAVAAEPILIFRKSDGFKMTVNYGTAADRTYCTHQPSSTVNDLKAVTIVDTTIIVNKGTTTAMTGTTSPTNVPYALIWAKKSRTDVGALDMNYSVTINNTQGDFVAASDGTERVINVFMASAAATYSAFNFTRIGGTTNASIVRVEKNDMTDFDIEASDEQGNTAIGIIKDKVEKLADLPPLAQDGDQVEITGDNPAQDGGYFVTFNETTGFWEESVKGGLNVEIDNETMPRQLVRGAGDTFDVSKITWQDRLVGDDISAPIPSFIGNTINDCFFHRGRFTILTEESIVLSRSNDFFNFFPTTATEVLDNDPIDLDSPSNTVAKFLKASDFQNKLVIWSKKKQFALTSAGAVLTPTSANLVETTSFEFTDKHQPVKVAGNVLFAAENKSFSSIWEYQILPDSQIDDAAEISSHINKYLPKDIKQLISNTSEKIVLAVSTQTGELGNLYCYNFFSSGDQKVLSSWNKWEFGQYREIIGGSFFGDELILVIKNNNSDATSDLTLERIVFDEEEINTDLGINIFGDRLLDPDIHTITAVSVGTPPLDTTTITLPISDQFDSSVVDKQWVAVHKETGAILQGTRTASETDEEISFPGNIVAEVNDYYYIKTFEWFTELSEWYRRDQAGQGIPSGVLKIKKLLVSFVKTGPFTVQVTPENRSTLSKIWTGIITGLAQIGLPLQVISTRNETFIVKANARGTKIVLKDSGPYPLNIQAITYQGMWNSRGRRNL